MTDELHKAVYTATAVQTRTQLMGAYVLRDVIWPATSAENHIRRAMSRCIPLAVSKPVTLFWQ